MLSKIPIFIAARGNNEMKIKKNRCALKFSFVFIRRMGLLDQTYIISDNQNMIDFAKRLGFKHAIFQECNSQKEVRYIEYNAIYNFYLKYKYKPDWFILLSIDALFMNTKLISECIRNIDYNYDVITSFTEISNRSNFFLNENGELDKNTHRITNEKDRRKMADATIYAINTDFAISCMKSEDPAVAFWNGKIKFFKNQSVRTDINEIGDIHKYAYIGEIIDEVKQLNSLLDPNDADDIL